MCCGNEVFIMNFLFMWCNCKLYVFENFFVVYEVFVMLLVFIFKKNFCIELIVVLVENLIIVIFVVVEKIWRESNCYGVEWWLYSVF